MWEHIEEFGDLHTVLYAEDCIVLHLETPWPTDSPVPNGCVLIPDSGLLTTNTKSLVAAKSALTEVKIRGALFAGCVEFKSSESLQDAVGQLLRATQKICIFHNRNAIYNLIRLFPNAKILALLHDLARHVIEEDEPYVNPLEPLVESSLLTDVIGSVGWINSGVLRISWVTLLAIFRTCPLVEVDSLETFIALSGFEHLRSLTVSFSQLTDVSGELGRVLETWPRLEKLHLDSCSGVRLSTINTRCRRLTHLGLVNSEVSAEGGTSTIASFRQLEFVQVSVSIERATFDVFLTAISRNLRTINCLDDNMTSWFLSLCFCGPVLFPRLENICLVTSSPLLKLNITPSDLWDVLKAVPALRYLVTDSYDLRVFVENFWEPRGRVSLLWCDCVVCGVEEPRLKAIWENFDMI
ncbi:uncharacterized protein LOC144180530 isoform X2 [Haemaphysalis longicornis]|uniref:Uncharacterized protein n=1 Tax=Haemaphysalis longicornis TaxID=44386 RepID=A0A9J6G122_HAELO|nr:hypothetical protein HPB48_001024 [Haemaphysalis longicornis]